MKSYTEAEIKRVIEVGSACADFVEKLMEMIREAETSAQADALFLSSVESLVDGVFWHLANDKEADMERHKFAAKVFTDLMMSRVKEIAKLDGNDGNNTENADGPLC